MASKNGQFVSIVLVSLSYVIFIMSTDDFVAHYREHLSSRLRGTVCDTSGTLDLYIHSLSHAKS